MSVKISVPIFAASLFVLASSLAVGADVKTAKVTLTSDESAFISKSEFSLEVGFRNPPVETKPGCY
jgi:hypothetical protein